MTMVRVRLMSLACLLCVFTVTGTAQKHLSIEAFDATLTVKRDSTVNVEERIRVRFTGPWNGIYRWLPLTLGARADAQPIRITPGRMTDGKGGELEHWVERTGGGIRFKIRVPDATDATRDVVVRYTALNVLRSYDDELHELYWNVTGIDWPSGIGSATCTIVYPAGIPAPRAEAFSGGRGASESDVATSTSGTSLTFKTTRALARGEGLTIVVGFEPGHFTLPTAADRVGWFLGDSWHLALGPAFLLLVFLLWWFLGRDPWSRESTGGAAKLPADLTPGEVGYFVDDRLDKRDLSATIVDLARRGYLRIEEADEDEFQLVKLGKSGGLRRFENIVFDAIFGTYDVIKLWGIQRPLHDKRIDIKLALESELTEAGYYRLHPARARFRATLLLVVGSLALLIAGFALGAGVAYYLLAALSVAIGIPLAKNMPQKSRKGLKALAQIRAFEAYLATIEDRSKTEVSGKKFSELLPMAMALGSERAWVETFAAAMEAEPPAWIRARPDATLSIHHLFMFSDSADTAVSWAPRSSRTATSTTSGFSSGVSGGGFGGGGGGGW